MKYIIASQHYKKRNGNHFECIAKFIQKNSDNTYSEVDSQAMLHNLKNCSFTYEESNQIGLPNPGEWVFYPADDVNKNNIDEVLNDIVWPEAN